MALGYLPLCLAAVHLSDGGRQFSEVDGARDGDVMRRQEKLDVRFQRGQSLGGTGVSREISFRNEKINWPGIERIAGEEKAVRVIE